jgi:hypothetical protein
MLRLATDIHRRAMDIHHPPMDTNRRATVIDHLTTDIRPTAPDIRQLTMRIHRQTIEAYHALTVPNRLIIHGNRRTYDMKRFAILVSQRREFARQLTASIKKFTWMWQ